jgi:hypothetical protein
MTYKANKFRWMAYRCEGTFSRTQVRSNLFNGVQVKDSWDEGITVDSLSVPCCVGGYGAISLVGPPLASYRWSIKSHRDAAIKQKRLLT